MLKERLPQPKDTPLRILLAEDSEADAQLLVRHLKHAGYEPTFQRVDTAAALDSALQREAWDIVIGDYSMPQFSGTAALALVRARDPDIPFIFVSGTIGEDVAVEAMRAGAQDYFIKGNLKRLVPAIERELREHELRRERRRTQQAFHELEQRFAKMFHASPVGMTISTLEEGRFLDANDSFLSMIGRTREEVIGHTALDLGLWSHRSQRETVIMHARQGPARDVQTTVRAKDGSTRDVLAALELVAVGGETYVLSLLHDVTAARLLERQLRQGQKMEAVGRLAGGVAHDFNNLLTVISGHGELLMGEFDAGDARRQDVEQILKAAQSAASLTRQLLAFSRQQVLQPRVLNPNEVISGFEQLLRRLIGDDIELTTVLRAEIGNVRVDPGQMEQIIVNLAVNARDAMPKGGKLTIETANAAMDEAYLRDHPLGRAGDYVMLAVSDTGIGMDAETQAHIFEPFFTTKESGKGTGLGLATVYGIVKQSDGFIWAYSEPGQGTTFKVYFPRETAAQEEIVPPPATVVGGDETILLVEDASAVRAITRDLLKRQGYTVIEAPQGDTALSIAGRHQGSIDLLLTDVVMPGLSGRELADQLTKVRPGLRVLFVSGYTDDAVVRHGVLEAGVSYLQKPFTSDDLARKVREVLDA